jgi:hypothetical protein
VVPKLLEEELELLELFICVGRCCNRLCVVLLLLLLRDVLLLGNALCSAVSTAYGSALSR